MAAALAGGCAAPWGLVFVAISLHPPRLGEHPGLRNRGRGTLVGPCPQPVVALVCLIPQRSRRALGPELVLLAAGLALVPVAITVSPESGEYQERPTIWIPAREGHSWEKLLTLDEAGIVALNPDTSGGIVILGGGHNLYALNRRTGQRRKRYLAVTSRGGGDTLEPHVLGLSTVPGTFRHRVLLVATDVGLPSSHDGGRTFERWQVAHADNADNTVLVVATSPAGGADRRIFAATAGGALLASEQDSLNYAVAGTDGNAP